MTVTIEVFKPLATSYGKVTLGSPGDTVAFDLNNSRQFAIQHRGAAFDEKMSLVDSPGEEDWMSLGGSVHIGVIQDGVTESNYLAGLERPRFGIAKWFQFKLLNAYTIRYHRVPTIQFRNIKNTRILTSNAGELELRSTVPTSLGLTPGSRRRYDVDAVVRREWFRGDPLTRFTAESADDTIVTARVVTRTTGRDNQGIAYDFIEIATVPTRGSGFSTTVTITALDAANNTASFSFPVTIT